MNRLAAVIILAIVAFAPSILHAQVTWKPWRTETFEQARRDNKLILIDVGTEWCSACNQMKAVTYRDERVRDLLARHFVTIHADAEAEPDIGERYGFWGWPALVFMLPSGEHAHFIRGEVGPDDFVRILTVLNDSFRKGELQPSAVRVDLVAKPFDGPVDALVRSARAAADKYYDAEHGGWGRPKMAFHDLIQQAAWRAHTSDPAWRQRVLDTAAKTRRLLDPVWGGVFFGARGADWSDLIYERRADQHASAIIIFAEAAVLTGDSAWLRDAGEVLRGLETMLRAVDGSYYTSQEMDLGEGKAGTSPADYYAKPDKERRAIGLPAIDTSVYADINARVAMALARLYEVSRDEKHLERAETIGRLLLARRTADGWVQQLMRPPQRGFSARNRELPVDINAHAYLRTQAFTGLALLAVYNVTGDADWFTSAHAIADAMRAKLWNEERGAFRASTRTVLGPDGKPVADQPLVDTAAAAEFLLRLAAYGKGRLEDAEVAQLRNIAERSLRAVSDPDFVSDNDRFIGQYVLAVHALKDEFIEATVVCADADAPACRALHSRTLANAPHVRKLVKVEQPGRYPDAEAPRLFVCTSKLCSLPFTGAEPDFKVKLSGFMSRLDELARTGR